VAYGPQHGIFGVSVTLELLLALGSMAAICLTQISVFLIFSGIGMLCRRSFGLREIGESDWFTAFWMGLAATTCFLMFWHFALAVNGWAVTIVLLVGLAGLYGLKGGLRDQVTILWRHRRGLMFSVAIVGLWVSNLAMGSLTLTDDSVGYHLQSIRWARQAAIMPGLANLHGPLGFTSGSTLYHALMQATPWGNFAHHVGASTLVIVLMAQGMTALNRIGKSGSVSAGSLFDLCLLPAAFVFASEKITSVTTDLPVMVVMMAAFSTFYRYVTRDDRNSVDAAYNVVTAATLFTLAVCFKFSTAVVAGLSWILVVGLWVSASRSLPHRRWKPVIWAAAISAGLFVAWIARSIVLSGYPVFPNTFGALQVPWRVPAEHALAEYEFIVHSGRATAGLLGTVPGIERFSVWFPRWLPRLVREDLFNIVVPGLFAASTYLAYLLSVRNARFRGALARGWLPLVPLGPGLVAWFVVAPEPRYVRYLFWTLAAVCLAQAIRAQIQRQGTFPARVVIGTCLALSLAPLIVNPIRMNPQLGAVAAVIISNLNRVPTGPGTATAVPAGTTFVTRSGLELFVPEGVHHHCFNAPQPCTPNPAPNLRLLRPGDPTSGFMVEGPWDMIGWPYEWLPNLLPALRTLRSQ